MITRESFGAIDGQEIHRFSLMNKAGLTARFINYGATLTELHTPDRQGRLADIVLGFDRLDGYRTSDAYMGATCGRYGNRIKAGRFSLDGRQYQLSLNEKHNHLHGGVRGYDKQIWNAAIEEDGRTLAFTHRAADGEEGYPGTLDLKVACKLTDANELSIDMTARADKPTIVNLVHHSYFNLAGHGSGDVLQQELKIASDFYTPVDGELIPTGEILPVKDTAFDFTRFKPVGRDIDRVPCPEGHAKTAGGYDHNLVLRGRPGEMRHVVEARDPTSGRAFDLETDEAGLQLYTAGELNETVIGKSGCSYRRYAGFTLETQRYPELTEPARIPATAP